MVKIIQQDVKIKGPQMDFHGFSLRPREFPIFRRTDAFYDPGKTGIPKVPLHLRSRDAHVASKMAA